MYDQIFLTGCKAFDSLDFNTLVNKLQSKFNFSYQSCCLIISYLKERIQMVKINGCFSEEAHIKYGVPQGSILGHYYSYYILMILKMFLRMVKSCCLQMIQA